MRSWLADAAQTGDLATPDEFNREAREILGTINGGLDRDNFRDVIEKGKLEVGAMTALSYTGTETEVPVDHVRSELVRGDVFPMPLESDDEPWVVEFVSGDGFLDLAIGAGWAQASVDAAELGGDVFWIGIRLDGEIVVQSPLSDPSAWEDEHAFAKAKVAVGARTHVLEVVYGGPIAHFVPGAGFETITITWKDRSMAIRECAR